MTNKLISVISPVKNTLHLLPHMIASLESQTYSNWEHIVVDGESDDGTLKFLSEYKSQKMNFTSEPDTSLYDAINKGVLKAQGQYICILNADDWYEPDFLQKAITTIESSGADWVFGNTMFHFADGTTHLIPGDPFYEIDSWATFTRFHHTSVLAKKECFDAVGNFPLTVATSKGKTIKLSICADYKWFLKLQKAGFRGFYDKDIMGHMRWGGISTVRQGRAHLEGKLVALSEFNNHKEIIRAWRRIQKKHATKKIIAKALDSVPQSMRSLLRRLVGSNMSSFIHEKVKSFRK
jgi:glycosyltransferase involved in cell wall biosynthesis